MLIMRPILQVHLQKESITEKNIEIRSNIIPGDTGSIIRLHGEYYGSKYGFDNTFESYVAIPLSECILRKDDRERIWIAEKGGEVIGCIGIVKHKKDAAQLRWFLLHEDFQGLGIGQELMKRAMEFAEEKKYKRIILWTINYLDRAIKIYEKNGFRLTKEKTHHIWGQKLTEQCFEKKL